MSFKINTCFAFIVSFLLFACNNTAQKAEATAASSDTIIKKDFSNIAFATKKDTSCGMPLTAGVDDTLHFEGKIYGFCSKECKDAFITQLKTEKKM